MSALTGPQLERLARDYDAEADALQEESDRLARLALKARQMARFLSRRAAEAPALSNPQPPEEA